ncbi:PBP1A family penicillin-binding protein [Paenibacillus sp. GP183]|uniref:PBP1A family penicillin-binding protein n=1 Tax=Paenibacillus sp. GP183 TaxID=1882751 RepID=UPI00089687D1|nr:PBP1A family penicillin-binding protein [Paenibacillus sp. GP183]SEB59816.1 penicillin-binding protein 2A [Paenibacillus sp. GP183]
MAATNHPKTPQKKGRKKKFQVKKLLLGAVIAAILAVICGMGMYILIMLNGAKILSENIGKMDAPESTHIYDVNGVEVSKLYRENRESVSIKDIPQKLKDAFIATEDRRFESHAGVDLYSMGRALYTDILHRSAVEGGSTITQQLAKNVFLSSQKTAFRKVSEVSIAIELERQFTKDQILEMYLNRIYFGSRAYGIKAASMVYFNQPDLNKLEVWQIATLAALPKAPSTYSPIENPANSKERRAVVLKLMADQGYITEAERAAAVDIPYVAPVNKTNEQYATFMDYVVKEAESVYNITEEELLTKGYKIKTTMDSKTQLIMEQTYANPNFFQKDAADGEKIQSAMVILNHQDGGIVGMIGGRDYKKKTLNRVFSVRQPGSAFKPIAVYGPALESGNYNPYSKMQDVSKTYGNGKGYTPNNYDNTEHGEVTMFEAVKRSYNLSAVWLLDQIGVRTGVKFAEKLGIKMDPKDNNLAIALGGLTQGASPMSMASAYSAFANQGTQNKSHAINQIEDSKGTIVAAFKQEKKDLISPKTAYYMTLLLQGVVDGGTGVRAKLDRPAAGKTGSTGLDFKGLEKYDSNVWFVGYTPEWTAAVWEGFDNTDIKHYVTVGSGSTAAIFKEVMSKALAGKPVKPFVKPNGVADLTEPPKSISDLAAVYAPMTKTVSLTWTPLQDSKVIYQVFRSDSKQNQAQMITQSPTAEVFDTTVSPGETYSYYVVPMNTDTSIAGDKSNIAQIAIPADGAVLNPLNPSPLPGGASPSPSPDGNKPSPSPSPSPNGGTGNGGGGKPSASPSSSPSPSPSTKPSPSPSPSATPATGAGT